MSAFHFSFWAQKIIFTTNQTSLVGPIIPSTSFMTPCVGSPAP